MSVPEDDPLTVSDTQTAPTSSHTSEAGIGSDVASLNSGLRRMNLMVGEQIRLKLRPETDDTDPLPQFLPLGDLESILSEGVVEGIIAEALRKNEAEAVEIRKKICGSRSEPRRIKILATLILIEKVEYIRHFLDHDVWDAKLPLRREFIKTDFRVWTAGDIDSFCYRQYEMLAPVFDFKAMKHCKFKKILRMPFRDRLEWECRGAHGTISKVRIDQDHQYWGSDSAPEHDRSCFALKKFISQDGTTFKQEKEALKRFSYPNKGHKHLVRLLLSYELPGEFFMIFPWAQGNLAEFWEKNPSDPTSRDDLSWFIRQCEGMASGLRKVHNHNSWPTRHSRIGDTSEVDTRNRGRHGDIKPENILFFAETGSGRGNLVIADFTLMRFHSMDTVDYTEANKVGFSETYCPPEVGPNSQSRVNQKYDIWTLGCVYLEFITWYLIGYDAIRKEWFESPAGKRLESFNRVRAREGEKNGVPTDNFFNRLDRSEAEVKDSVMKWIRMLRGNQHCSEAIRKFLDLVDQHMLVPKPNNRWSMDLVYAELRQISLDCQRDDHYHRGKPGLISDDDDFPPEFTEQTKQYHKGPIMTLQTSTSSRNSRPNSGFDTNTKASAEATSSGHQPCRTTSQDNAFSSRLGDQPTEGVKRKAGQHPSQPHTRSTSKRRETSNHNFEPDPPRSFD